MPATAKKPKSKERFQSITFNLSGKPRREMLDGKEHLVVPTVMIVEGVLNGSGGPLMYRGEDLQETPQLWDHKPVVLYHPAGKACDPVVLNSRKLGVVLNTEWDPPKLRTEAWLDIERCNALDKRIIENLEAGKVVEVSTGLFTTNKSEEGEWNGTSYSYVATSHRPDHLAILPDQVGACSVADGAGLGVWNSIKEGTPIDDIQRSSLMCVSTSRPVENVKSYQDVTNELYTLLQARFGYSAWIDAVFDAYFVYSIDGTMYKLNYTKSDKSVKISDGDPVEVYRDVQYITANGEGLATVKTSKVPLVIKNKESEMTKKEKIDQLIANAGYEESDRVMLDGFSDEKIDKLIGNVKTVEPKKVENTNPSPTVPAPQQQQVQNLDTYLQTLPPEVAAVVRNNIADNESKKKTLIEKIVAVQNANLAKNKATRVLNSEWLQTLEPAALEGILAMGGGTAESDAIPSVQSFFGQQGVTPTLNADGSVKKQKPLPSPTLNGAFANPFAEKQKMEKSGTPASVN